MQNTSLSKKISQQPFDGFAADRQGAEPSVVHTCYGRVRVHLPCWRGMGADEIARAVQRLAGVTHAEANVLTGNLLILFQPRETNVRVLLNALPSLQVSTLRLVEDFALVPTESSDYLTGAWRVVYQAMGWGSVGMAVVGAITPGIPTAPFVILAGYFFIRSSPEGHKWLRESRWFGPVLRDWEEHRGVRRSIRNAVLALIAFGMAVTLWLGLPPLLTASIVGMQVLGVVIVLSLRVVESEDAEPVAGVLQLPTAGR